MSGKPINSEQVKLYMRKRKAGKTQATASARSGISERSGRRIDTGELEPCSDKQRYWRTRADPFIDVWDSEIVPLLMKNHGSSDSNVLLIWTCVYLRVLLSVNNEEYRKVSVDSR